MMMSSCNHCQILKKCDYHFFFELQLTFQPMDVLTTQL